MSPGGQRAAHVVKHLTTFVATIGGAGTPGASGSRSTRVVIAERSTLEVGKTWHGREKKRGILGEAANDKMEQQLNRKED